MIRLKPKFWFLTLLVIASLFAMTDHLTSPSSPAIASQTGGGCAPCGAPCTLTE